MNSPAPDQSMEDVLASIKRVMARDTPSPETPARRRTPMSAPVGDDVLELRPEDQDEDQDSGGLSSPATVHATRRKLRSLQEVDASHGPTEHGIEGWVTDLMKPMLREWLDEHLPAIVEAAVEREVRRITRG